MPDNFELTLKSTKDIGDNTVHFEFDIKDGQQLELIAGQFIRLMFAQDGQQVFRSYSVANILSANTDCINSIQLAVSWVKGGLATVGLSQMQIGDSIQASAPYGRFCLTEQKWQRYFLIATGTGVTPYRAMTNELKQRIAQGAEVFVVMGARDESGLLYEDEFRQNALLDNYNYVSCLSRIPLNKPAELDFNGHVQTYLEKVQFNPETDIAYLCGNPAMVDDAFTLLKEAGLPVAQIRREKYVSPPKRKKKITFEIKN
ncbi:MAG TPA: ferredoxin--NADP reductase [Oceanospirillales bacterium]|nr:ferredoxin--NADP reductase [Oceanospirillales bacterium]